MVSRAAAAPVDGPVGDGGELFVVTTRSRLKGPQFFGHMMLASFRVRRQLKATGNVVAWASMVSGPTEFWTITVWRSQHDMAEFASTGAHDEIMWLFAKWLRSFWLMRWRPASEEIGTWRGTPMAVPPRRSPDDPEAAARRNPLLDQALANLPRLREAIGPDGAARYDHTPVARRRRAEVGRAAGAIVHLAVRPAQTLAALAELRRVAAICRADADLLRITVGVGRPGEVYLLGLWADAATADALVAGPAVAALRARRGEGLWAMRWTPENEFGHWDGLRVRRTRDRRSIRLTPEQAALGDDEQVDTGAASRRRRSGVSRRGRGAGRRSR